MKLLTGLLVLVAIISQAEMANASQKLSCAGFWPEDQNPTVSPKEGTNRHFRNLDGSRRFDSIEAEALARRLIETRDPNHAFEDLVSFRMKIQFSGKLFEEFVDDQNFYRGRTMEVINYPKMQTSIWKNFPGPGQALIYTRISERGGIERLLHATVSDAGQIVIDQVINEPLDNLAVQYKRGGMRQQFKILKELGGASTQKKRQRLKAMAQRAKEVDNSFFGQMLTGFGGGQFSPKKGQLVYWNQNDVASFFGQALNAYNWFPNILVSSNAVEKVELVEKPLTGKSDKQLALDVTFSKGMRINPGQGGTMRYFLTEAPDSALTSQVFHYDVRFMTNGDPFLRAHHQMDDYREVEDGRGLLFPFHRKIRFRFKGDQEGVKFDGFVEREAPTGIEAFFQSVKAVFSGTPDDMWDKLVMRIQHDRGFIP